MELCKCADCGKCFEKVKLLSDHIRSDHLDSIENYVIRNIYSGERPRCKSCSGLTRFVSLRDGYKKYCPNCADVASVEGGRQGGINKSKNLALNLNVKHDNDVNTD